MCEEQLETRNTIPLKGRMRAQPETQTQAFPLPTERLRKRPKLLRQDPKYTTFKGRRILPLIRNTAEDEKPHRTHISESIGEWVENLPESFTPDNILQHRLAEKKHSASLRRTLSESSRSIASVTSSDQKSRDGKSAAYAHKGYQMLLRTAGVLLESELPISDESDTFCQSLLKAECCIPEDSLLRDDIYRDTIADLAERNESRVIQDVGRLYVPSVQTLAKISEKRFQVFIESVSEAWDCCYPLIDPRPQPDYAVGFGRSGLSEARIDKLQPLILDAPDFRSDFKSTYYMYFPFFATEVQCGTSGLVIADRQNGHTMGVGVHGIVTLHRLAGKELEIHNKPVAFSISHDHRTVRLTGWGPVIDGDFYTVHPFAIHSFDVTALKGLERWTPRRFTIGVFEYGLTLLDKINAIIDELPPDLNLERVQPLKLGLDTGFELPPPNCSGTSQQLDAHSLSGSGANLDSQQSIINSQESTLPTLNQMETSLKRAKA